MKFPGLYPSPSAAFSLVEVVLALSIASFTILSMLGLLSIGFQNSRDSVDRDTQNAIARSILSQAQLGHFDRLSQFNDSNYFFDGQGLPTAQSDAIYKARSSIEPPQNQAGFSPSRKIAVNLVVDVWGLRNPTRTNRIARLIVSGD